MTRTRMFIYGTLITALAAVAALRIAQPPTEPIDHTSALKEADGSWKYTNRLADSSSPYLLQHAHNPVDWYQWGEEAFKAAREQNKPIFLSVGYSTCYWCHVMEREVFENPEIAALMNQLFICIKVDREQRPDIDEIYMTATQLMTQQGGWPNSVFLTPDLKPFYAGTYFGPTDQSGRPGFPTLIRALDDAWRNRRADVLTASDQSAAAIARALNQRAAAVSRDSLGTGVTDLAVSQLAQRYDARLGGFGGAPKFPQDFYYEFLFDVHRRTGAPGTLDMAVKSLVRMAAGGIYDHVGGGFHRYSTDAQWVVPHFEKMLYNHAQLTRAYVAAWQSTQDEAFADVARGILRHVAEVMTGPDGQFYSALDAETDAVEGAYYVWTRAEVGELLDDQQMALFDRVFALGEVPTFPGHKHPEGGVLYMRKPIREIAVDLDVSYADLRDDLDAMLRVLKARRDGRELPRLDDKVIAGWNGMMIGAYAKAGAAFEDENLLAAARRGADFVLDRMVNSDGRLLRLWRQGVVEQPAFQEDYAFFIQGLLALHDATGEAKWLDQAVELAKGADQLFWDAVGGGYYFAQRTPDLIARSKSTYDGAIPSGNSAMLHNLVTLWQKTRNEIWRDRYEGMLEAFGGVMAAGPVGHIHMVHALERWEQFAPIDQPSEDASIPGIEIPRISTGETKVAPMDSSDHVKAVLTIEPREVAPGAVFTIRVRLDIGKGWHINANAVSSPLLIPTVVDLRGENPVEVLKVAYPKAEVLAAAYAPEPIRVFEGATEVVITARLSESASAGTAIALPVFMQYQACDDSRCLPPAEVVQEVSLLVSR